jgi:hypothetical protein
MAQHVIRIGRNEHSFPLHLLDDETLHTGHASGMLEIARQAAKSPFGRSTVVFLCPEAQPVVRDTYLYAMRQLMEGCIPGIRGFESLLLSYDDPRLPSSYMGSNEAPLVCFSIARVSCLMYAMALANVRYFRMECDFATWLHTERLVEQRQLEGSGVAEGKLTGHGVSIESQLLSNAPDYPWHYPLPFVTPIFDQFVRRCERLPNVTSRAA